MATKLSSKSVAYRLLVAALLLCACKPGLASKNQPVPQWGLDAYKTHVPDYAKDAAAIILYDEYVETVDASGRAIERERRAKRVLKPQGRGEVTCDVGYSEDEKITYFRVWTIAADEKQVAETLATLPFSRFFDADVYPTTPPDAAEIAHRARS